MEKEIFKIKSLILSKIWFENTKRIAVIDDLFLPLKYFWVLLTLAINHKQLQTVKCYNPKTTTIQGGYMSISKTKHLFSALVLAATLTLTPDMAHATHSWGSYHWARISNPFTLKLGNNLTNITWSKLLTQTSTDWNSPIQVGATSPIVTAVAAGQSSRNCSMVKGTTQVCNSKYGNNGWLGLATINVSGVHITQGSAKMNDTYFNTTKYNYANEKLHVICQEVAHTFGLDHQSEDGSSQNTCMDYYSNTGSNATSTLSTKPNLHDFEQLNSIYIHNDLTTTVAAVLNIASSGVDITNDSASWGRLVGQSAGGRSSFYERDNANGSQTLTHVYWTIEAASDCVDCDHRYDNHDRR